MNEFDPMKNNASNQNNPGNQDTYQAYDGQGYTNPNGSHGFIYNPDGPHSRKGDQISLPEHLSAWWGVSEYNQCAAI